MLNTTYVVCLWCWCRVCDYGSHSRRPSTNCLRHANTSALESISTLTSLYEKLNKKLSVTETCITYSYIMTTDAGINEQCYATTFHATVILVQLLHKGESSSFCIVRARTRFSFIFASLSYLYKHYLALNATAAQKNTDVRWQLVLQSRQIQDIARWKKGTMLNIICSQLVDWFGIYLKIHLSISIILDRLNL